MYLALCRCNTSKYSKIYLLTIHNINGLEQYNNYSGKLFGLGFFIGKTAKYICYSPTF